MQQYRFILDAVLDDEPGKPLVEATKDVELPICPAIGSILKLPIPGGIVYPDTDANGLCLCKNFGQCCHPNRPWTSARCSVDDLEEEAIQGKGPGGYFTFPVTMVLHVVGGIPEIRCDARAIGGRGCLDMLTRSGFTVVTKNKPTDADDEGEEEADDDDEA